jgi:hypothetical protein
MRIHASLKLVGLGAVAVAMVGPALLILQAPAQAAGCAVWAGTPVAASAYDEVRGSGGRSGCATAKQLKVDLKWDKPLSPDPVLDYRSGTYVNVTLQVAYSCLAGAHDYYVEVSGDAGSASSDPRKRITGLNC